MTAMTEAARKTCALVVEDDPNIVDLIRSNLAVRGFDTVVSVDGMRALQLLETEDPDIVLLDLMLPEADGFELCRQIRERSPTCPSRSASRNCWRGSPRRCAGPVPPRPPSSRRRRS